MGLFMWMYIKRDKIYFLHMQSVGALCGIWPNSAKKKNLYSLYAVKIQRHHRSVVLHSLNFSATGLRGHHILFCFSPYLLYIQPDRNTLWLYSENSSTWKHLPCGLLLFNICLSLNNVKNLISKWIHDDLSDCLLQRVQIFRNCYDCF